MKASSGITFKSRSKTSLENLDIFVYVNFKFIYSTTSRSSVSNRIQLLRSKERISILQEYSETRRDFGDKLATTASNNDYCNRCSVNVRNVNLDQDLGTPSVIISSKDLKREITFLIDTGSESNILKINKPDDWETIAGRTCDVVKVKVSNNEIKTGNIPSLNLGDGIYAGEDIVTNLNRKVKITIPMVQLEEFETADEHDVSPLGHDAHVVDTMTSLAYVHLKTCSEYLIHVDMLELLSLGQGIRVTESTPDLLSVKEGGAYFK
ncbi:hypothetical protein V1478_005098 [Vespula squamosa]|uniref:Peptidase A2 domain-containing protein n=1 Tax=Vespula squamosa TaxID=30214 RepID=A0ABD2BD81_VESSQ